MAAEIELLQRGALDAYADELAKASRDALRIERMPMRSVVNLRGATADQSLITDAQRALGIELPLMPDRWHGTDRIAAIWLGPDEWLLVAPDGEAADIENTMRESRAKDPWLSLVDVSHNYTALMLSGPRTRDLLAKGCALDLHSSAFSAGHCAQTILAKSRVLLRAVDGENSIELWVRNSFAGYLAEWLLDACEGSQREKNDRVL
jgi:sarcosine oxidase subunit gamma